MAKEAAGWEEAQSMERGMGSSQSPVLQFFSLPTKNMHPEGPVQTCPGHCWILVQLKSVLSRRRRSALKIAGKSSDAF